VYAYLALCAIFSILWIFRILRALKPIRTTSESPPQFEGAWKNWRIYSFTGHVRGTAVGISTFRLVDSRIREERNFQLGNWGVQLFDDQLVSVVWAIRKHRKEGPYFMIVNHTTGERFIRNDVVMEIAKRPSLFWTLSYFICFVIPPVWLLAIIWGILIGNQTERFKKSGVQPLVENLNQKAKKLL